MEALLDGSDSPEALKVFGEQLRKEKIGDYVLSSTDPIQAVIFYIKAPETAELALFKEGFVVLFCSKALKKLCELRVWRRVLIHPGYVSEKTLEDCTRDALARASEAIQRVKVNATGYRRRWDVRRLLLRSLWLRNQFH